VPLVLLGAIQDAAQTRSIHPAAELFLRAGQRVDGPQWLRLQIVLGVALRKHGIITAASILKEVNKKITARNAVAAGSNLSQILSKGF